MNEAASRGPSYPTPPEASTQICPCGSGAPFSACHGAVVPKPIVPSVAPEVSTLPMAPPVVTRKLDLACGQNPREGYEGVDIWEGAQHRVNLFKYPWPFEDNSVSELSCSHYIEHIPAIEVDEHGNQVPYGEGQDALFRFFDECWRILIPEGWMHVQWPSLRSNRAFQDPTHRRFIPEQTMGYLWKDWRVANKLDHYNVKCNFISDVGQSFDPILNTRHEAVRAQHILNFWNGSVDFLAKLKAIKP